MNHTSVMSPVGVQYIERDEMLQLLVRKIETMPDDTAELMFNVLERAAQAANDAAHGGEKGDRGASAIAKAVDMYVHGWFKVIPREWSSLSSRLKAARDPEYGEYQRLKKKFEGA